MRRIVLSMLAAIVLPSPTAASASQVAVKRAPDLADAAAGVYEGSVVADARGSSGAQVVVTVTRVAKNVVELGFDYARVPTVRVPLQRAMAAILSASVQYVFLIQRDKDPRRLDLSIDGVTMIVRKR